MKKFMSGLLVLLIAGFAILSFLRLDPEERRPGLRLSGALAEDQNPDWSFLNGRNKIYVQMSTWYFLPHSITTTSWVRDGQLYVPCGRCASKNWPNHVARDNRVTLKVQDQLYERAAIRVIAEPDIRIAMNIPVGEPLPEGVWVYRMDAR